MKLVVAAITAFSAWVCLARAQDVPAWLEVLHPSFARPLTDLERTTNEARPPLRNFFPPLGADVDPPGAWRSAAWDAPNEDEGAAAAELVAKELARNGLLATLAHVVETHRERAADRGWLASIGLPLDWIDRFQAPDGSGALAFVLAHGADGAAKCALRFHASVAGFEAATESGEHAIGALRIQLSNPAYWQAKGDGSSIDVTRQMIAAFPDAPAFVALDAKNVDAFVAEARAWKLERKAPVHAIAQDLPVAQWAQDDGKCGFANGEIVTLVPRYACRGEEASAWAPGEMRALEGFAAAGGRVARSPLLFQGGDLLVVRDPKRGERVLIAGEAEILRNVSLGLSREEVLEAFRVELGVARVVELPAVSYHVDYEVSPRAIGGELVCFVNDPHAAAKEILRVSIDVLERAAKLDATSVAAARDALAKDDATRFQNAFAPVLLAQSLAPGQFRESFAKLFRDGEGDSHVGNFQRVLLALDVFVCAKPSPPSSDRFVQSFVDAFRRRDASREELAGILRAQGWRVVPVPSLSMDARGIDYLNGIQAEGVYVMPAWGGLFAPLDRAARGVFERELGAGVRVVEIGCSESQRRVGAVRCAVAVLPPPARR